MHICSVCTKGFPTPSKLNRHLRSHAPQSQKRPQWICPVCGKHAPTPSKLTRHLRAHEQENNRNHLDTPDQITIQESDTRDQTRKRKRPADRTDESPGSKQTHQNRTTGLSEQTTENVAPSHHAVVETQDENLTAVIKRNWRWIRNWKKTNRTVKDSYNIHMVGYDKETLRTALTSIFEEQGTAFKLNVSVGSILEKRSEQNGDEAKFRYFYASENTNLLPRPEVVGNVEDFKKVLDNVLNADVESTVLQNRPETAFKFKTVTNVLVNVFKIRNHAIGDTEQTFDIGDTAITDYIRKSKSILSFATTEQNQPNKDKLCLFRALAYHLTKEKRLEKPTRDLFQRWAAYRHLEPNIATFQGVYLADLDAFEKLFKINVRVYTLVRNDTVTAIEEGDADEEVEEGEEVPVISAKCLRQSKQQFTDTITLNLNFNHFSYVSKLEAYCRSWRCHRCDRFFSTKRSYERHLDSAACDGDTKFKYPGGGFGLAPTVFELLEQEGILVSKERRFYPYRAVYDFECRFKDNTEVVGESKLRFTKTLIPASVSLMSNIPGYNTPNCILNEDPDLLVGEFLGYVSEMAESSFEILADDYADVVNQIDQKIEVLKELRERAKNIPKSEEEVLFGQIKTLEPFEGIKLRFTAWLKQLPVLGFNSGKFDLNLIKNHLIPHLLANTEAKKIRPIKRGQTFMSLSLEHANFLDISNYLGAGTSYQRWIKAFGIAESKGIWPYEWFKTFDQLDEEQLPKQEEFYSTLKQKGISDEEYQDAQMTWIVEDFKTMRDMLIWYNNLDVEPFLQALEKMLSQFRSMGFDMLKQGAISLPGLAMLHLFSRMDIEDFFQLFDEKSKHWHEIIRQNIVGGPSIIFHRMQVAGMTKIRGKLDCKSIQGFDANALYLYCTGLEMPVGLATEYTQDTDTGVDVATEPGIQTEDDVLKIIDDNMMQRFRKQRSPGESELYFVFWIFKRLQDENPNQTLTLRHRYSGQGQKKFFKGKKPIFVDGYVPELKTIIQFHGCRWHGCICQRGIMEEEDRLRRVAETTRIKQFLETTGSTIIEGYECEFKLALKQNVALEQYIGSLKLWGKYKMNAADILRGVRSGNFFGLVECDIQVPWWKDGMREKFEEMAPIFKNTLVSRDDIGPTMRAYAEETKTMSQPRRALIGSYFGRKVLLATPLLQWYIAHGLEVTRVYGALEFRSKRVFKHLADEVSGQRAAADRDPNKKVMAELYKLLGNSYYGKCLTNKLKQNNVMYVDEEKASQSVNEKRFQNAEEITKSCFEVSMRKAEVSFDLPILVAFFVYSGAKQRMLEFYYDFLDVVLEREDFEMIEMDTDSLYFALSHDSLEAAVPQGKRHAYEELKRHYLALDTDPFSPTYDQRTPGLFKVEWTGAGMVALNSKTYIGWNTTDDGGTDKIKKSTKGLNKQTNDITMEQFRSVLETREAVSGTNYGFRMRNGKLVQYQQEKRGLTFFYPKRIVQEDGVSTKPLNI